MDGLSTRVATHLAGSMQALRRSGRRAMRVSRKSPSTPPVEGGADAARVDATTEAGRVAFQAAASPAPGTRRSTLDIHA